MRQLITITVFLILAPWMAVTYIILRLAWELGRRHRLNRKRPDRFQYLTPAANKRFDELHSERLHRVVNVGQPVFGPRGSSL